APAAAGGSAASASAAAGAGHQDGGAAWAALRLQQGDAEARGEAEGGRRHQGDEGEPEPARIGRGSHGLDRPGYLQPAAVRAASANAAASAIPPPSPQRRATRVTTSGVTNCTPRAALNTVPTAVVRTEVGNSSPNIGPKFDQVPVPKPTRPRHSRSSGGRRSM